jgi:hypothetical protein
MTTYTTYSTDGSTIATKSGAASTSPPKYAVIHNDIDFAKRNVIAADVVEALSIPANTMVQHVGIHVLSGEASQTMSVGDGDGTSSWLSAKDVATTGNVYCSALALTAGSASTYVETITGYSGGKFYSAADTIDILVPSNKAYTTLKVRIFAAIVQYT